MSYLGADPFPVGPFKFLERCFPNPQYKPMATRRLEALVAAHQTATAAILSAENVIDLVMGRIQSFRRPEVVKFQRNIRDIAQDLSVLSSEVNRAWSALLSELELRFDGNQCPLTSPHTTGAGWLTVFNGAATKANEYTRVMKAQYVGMLELAASVTLDIMEECRVLLGEPILWGDPILVEVEQDLADLETAVVQAQSIVTVETEELDTEGIPSVTSGFVALQAIEGRAQEVLAKLKNRIIQIKEEKRRQEDLAAREARRLEQEEAQIKQVAAQTELQAIQREQRARSAAQIGLAEQIRELDAEINRERALLLRAKHDLEQARADEARHMTLAAQLRY
jgi:hypothetical protein